MSMFKFTLKTQAPKAMVEPFDANPMTKLCIVINTNEVLIQRLNEYLKLFEITNVGHILFFNDIYWIRIMNQNYLSKPNIYVF
jgi:hypothetical protein